MNVSTEADREALRREHGVRLIGPEMEGFAATALPAGLYGFTSSPALASPLFSARKYRNFEVHRLPASPAVIGFVTPEDAAALATTTGPVAIKLFPEPDDTANVIVSISYDRIVQHRQYSVRNAAAVTLEIAPQGSGQHA